MAEKSPQSHDEEENKERGSSFDFLTKKKEEIKTEDAVMTDNDLNGAANKETKEEKHTLLDELQRTHSHSSSSSDEEVEGEGGERKKKKKKGLKDTEIITTDESSCVPMEKCSTHEVAVENAETVENAEEKKGFLEKIMEKLPGQHNKVNEEDQNPAAAACEHSPVGNETKEKKGIVEKIKDKLPGGGHHKINNQNEVEN